MTTAANLNPAMRKALKRNAARWAHKLAQKWAPPERIGTMDWANKHRWMSEVETARPGKYSIHVTPALALPGGPLEAIDDPNVEEVCCQKSAQVAWTSGVLGNALGRWIDVDPSPIIGLFPKDGAAKEYVAEKFEPMVEATPRLRDKIDLRSRKLQQRQQFKRFPGGFLKLVGSNSPSSVKSTPSPRGFVEEPDDCNLNLKGQGDSILLLKERGKTYGRGRKKYIIGGTPTIAGISSIEAEMQLSDKRRCLVPCHHCGESHELSFDNLVCPTTAEQPHPIYGAFRPEQTVYACPHCGSEWNDREKNANLRRGSWVATAEFRGVAGYYMNELLSTFPDSRFAKLMEKWLSAQHNAEQGDFSDLIVFTNSSMGLAYQFKGDAPEVDELKDRAEEYAEKTIPRGGLLVTAGVDVQHDRLAVVIRAWGRGEESWLIYWGELYGNTMDKTDPVFDELDKLMTTGFEHESGASLRVSAVGIDSSDGHTSDAIYHYVRARQRHGVMAVKGASLNSENKEIFSRPKVSDDTNRQNTKADKYGLRPFIVGTHKAKDLIDARIRLKGIGPGRMHWYQDVRPDYWEQLTAEVKAPHPRNPRKRVWQKKAGKPNEALDCEVYALHAARSCRTHVLRASDWDRLEATLTQTTLFESPAVATAQQPAAPQRKRRRMRNRSV
ncbi:phage terminase large subunit family protein [Vreelandella populi]|uniref:phage terminase large subunit family protein n=1 Tax=Vreelandella populi TaxID=2498858 RepID=UPI0021AFE04A|nr:phage terminase large subunit family protein [Halomonas populi]